MSVKNKVVIITGASSGIGEAAARLLAQNGAKVVLGARRIERLAQITEEIRASGGEAEFAVCDVVKLSDLENLVKIAKEKYLKIDVIFNNAGIMPSSPLSAMHTQEWNDMIDINIKGVLNGIAAVLPDFVRQKSGHIITTSSIAGLKNFHNAAVYGATKFAVKNIMEVLRMESSAEGTNIRTSTLYPGAINTELLNTITDKTTLKGMTEFYRQIGIDSSAVARTVLFAIDQPEDVNISEFTILPTKQP
jgi:NADP-dependent 3-hydroxy acid dehydrogenase YdfG